MQLLTGYFTPLEPKKAWKTLGFNWPGWSNGGKNPPPPPKKKREKEKIPKISHAELPRHKNVFAGVRGRDTWELSRILRLFWIPEKSLLKSSYPKEYLPKSTDPKKSRNLKFQTQKNPSIIPVTWNPEYTPPPPPLPTGRCSQRVFG